MEAVQRVSSRCRDILDEATLALFGWQCDRRSGRRLQLLVTLAFSLLLVQGSVVALEEHAGGLVRNLRSYKKAWRLLAAYSTVRALADYPTRGRRVFRVVRLWLTQTLAVCTLHRPAASFTDSYLTLGLVAALSRETPKEVALRSAGLASAVLGASLVVVGLTARHGPGFFALPERRASELLASGVLIAASGLLLDDLQSVVGVCSRSEDCLPEDRAPTFTMVSHMVVYLFAIFYSHHALRSLQTQQNNDEIQ